MVVDHAIYNASVVLATAQKENSRSIVLGLFGTNL